MASLSDYIEDYIKKLISLSTRRYVDIQRGELAKKFDCVPSQINYVLSTRFGLERGYLVESKRGGRGYIRIYRVEPLQAELWDRYLKGFGGEFEPHRARNFVRRLYEENLISLREARLLDSLLHDELYSSLVKSEARRLQKNLLKGALEALLKESVYYRY